MLSKVLHELMELCMFTAAVMLCLPLFLLLLLHMSDATTNTPGDLILMPDAAIQLLPRLS